MLLRSRAPRGESGVGEPLYLVDVLVWQGGRVAYGFARLQLPVTRLSANEVFHIDDVLDLRDVTGDGIPEVIFHAGFIGASDFAKRTHVLYQAKGDRWWHDRVFRFDQRRLAFLLVGTASSARAFRDGSDAVEEDLARIVAAAGR